MKLVDVFTCKRKNQQKPLIDIILLLALFLILYRDMHYVILERFLPPRVHLVCVANIERVL